MFSTSDIKLVRMENTPYNGITITIIQRPHTIRIAYRSLILAIKYIVSKLLINNFI